MTNNTNQEKLSFQTEVKQLLDIVVHSLYSNKEIFLRELVSNASDALDKLRFESLSNNALYESDSDLTIRILYDKEARTITIRDNGIGMSRDEVIGNLGTIAKSGTREFLTKLTGDQKKDAHLIGQFGVGFYSAFIVADKVTVLTRRAGLDQEEGVQWDSQGDGEYTISTINKPARGTDVILHLKKDEDDFLDDWRLRSIITKYSDHLNIPIQMQKRTDDGQVTDEWQLVNQATALWTLAKSAITETQYQEFYKHIAHDYENPLAYTHHRIEGANIDYTCLLYLPARAPMDLWQRDANRGLKLYVQRVFIMDHVEQFMPLYLRFVRGVLDTSALSLNISREILQEHPTIAKLRSALVRHVLDLLEKLSNDEPEKYATFWQEFGSVLKEGPAEDFANRERIAKLFRFTSTKAESDVQTVTLDDYINRMKPNQTKIYYCAADSLNTAKYSPHLEVFRKNDIEVLLLSDRIDEWFLAHLTEFSGKSFQSVAKEDDQLKDIIKDQAVEDEVKKEQEQQTEFDVLLKQFKIILDDKVKEVRLSHRLTTSPTCLVRDQHALGPQMERLLKATGQPITESKPIFEINPDHAIIQKLQTGLHQDQLNDWAHLLYEQALLAEGSALPDTASFVNRMNKLWIELFK